jgi:hypothetical protein
MIDLIEKFINLLQAGDTIRNITSFRFSLQNCCLVIIFIVFIAAGILLAIPIAFFNQ